MEKVIRGREEGSEKGRKEGIKEERQGAGRRDRGRRAEEALDIGNLVKLLRWI